MANENQFIEGIKVFKPSENAPDFVVANGKIDADVLQQWLSKQSDNSIKFQIKKAKETGYYYIAIDTYTKS
jgi:hypothetical protein